MRHQPFALTLAFPVVMFSTASHPVAQAPTGTETHVTKPRHAAASTALSNVMVTKAVEGIAVVRLGSGELEKVWVGDLIGKTKAVVKEIAPGRLVLEETFTAEDGRPNRALIIIKEGQRGGARYLQRSDDRAVVAVKPSPAGPPAPASPDPPPRQR